MALVGATIQGGVSAKRDRKQRAEQSANELAYYGIRDAADRALKERELGLSNENYQHEWEGQAATRDSTLAQLYKAQAIEARRAAMGRSFASALGRGGAGDAGGEATKRLQGLLGKVNTYGGSV